MKTSLDCIPCFIRQALDAARMVTEDPIVHEQIVREVLHWTAKLDFNQPPPLMGQRIHRRLREITGVQDPYLTAKEYQNRMALNLLLELKTELEASSDPLAMAVRLAIAGNVIDMGVNGNITESAILENVRKAFSEQVVGCWDDFFQAVAKAKNILYLADNAGEIVFDRLLIEQLPQKNITLVVRGMPIINDVTRADVLTVGFPKNVKIIDNGSDAPGTILSECSREFVQCFMEADLIIAKGQGNFETLSDEMRNIFFLFKAKCPVIAAYVGLPVGTHVLARSGTRFPDVSTEQHSKPI